MTCCRHMRRELERECDTHPDRFACPDALVAPVGSGLGLIVHDGGTSVVAIYSCPWCGADLHDGRVELDLDIPEHDDITMSVDLRPVLEAAADDALAHAAREEYSRDALVALVAATDSQGELAAQLADATAIWVDAVAADRWLAAERPHLADATR